MTELAAHRPTARDGAGILAAVALVAIAGAALLYAVSRGTDLGLDIDRRGFISLPDQDTLPAAQDATRRFVATVDSGALAIAALAVIGVALVRRRAALGALALAAIAGANVSTQVLKPLLGRVDPLATDAARELPAAFPSGHATVAMSVALGLVLVAPPASRPLAALLGAGYAAAMGIALMALGWHYPSDVAGGFLVATAFAAAAGAVALRRGVERPPPSPARVRRAAAGAGLLAAGAVVALAVLGLSALVERPELLDIGRVRTTFVAASVAIAILAAVLAVAVAAPLTASRARP